MPYASCKVFVRHQNAFCSGIQSNVVGKCTPNSVLNLRWKIKGCGKKKAEDELTLP